MLLYYVDSGSCYLEIVRVKYRNNEYIKAHVRWYSRPGTTLLFEEKNMKIPLKAKSFWKQVGFK